MTAKFSAGPEEPTMEQAEKKPLLGNSRENGYESVDISTGTTSNTGKNSITAENSLVFERSVEFTRYLCACIPLVWLNIFLSLLTLFTLAFKTVALPAYVSAVISAGSDPFSVALIAAFWFQLFFLFVTLLYKLAADSSQSLVPESKWTYILLIGFCNGVAGVPLVFASDPSRTPPYLQALLSTVVIPLTVLCRYVILKKAVGVRRLLCAVAVIVGFVLSLVPQLTGNEQHPSQTCVCDVTNTSLPMSIFSANETGFPVVCVPATPPPLWYRIMWPVIYVLGFVPLALMYVLAEMEMKKSEVRSLTFLLWLHILTFWTLVLLFWTDLIPEFGMATSIGDFWDRLTSGITCHFSVEPGCEYVVISSWMYILGNCLNLLFQFLLTRHGEGSVYPTVVSAVSTPLAALFWTMFILDPFFVWSPSFNITTVFIIGGLVIMVPAVALYYVFSMQEEANRRTYSE